jgi:hypothetical protein
VFVDVSGSAVGTANLSHGIHIGNVVMASISAAQRLSVCNNQIRAYLDGWDTSYPAGIRLEAVVDSMNLSAGANAVVCSNHIACVGLNASSVHGLYNYGWRESQFADNVVICDSTGVDLYENLFVGATASTIWTNNRAGDSVANGAIVLASPPYKAQTNPDNWNGATFT